MKEMDHTKEIRFLYADAPHKHKDTDSEKHESSTMASFIHHYKLFTFRSLPPLKASYPGTGRKKGPIDTKLASMDSHTRLTPHRPNSKSTVDALLTDSKKEELTPKESVDIHSCSLPKIHLVEASDKTFAFYFLLIAKKVIGLGSAVEVVVTSSVEGGLPPAGK